MSCGVGCRHGSDPALLRLWRRPVATAPIQPLAWESPYAAGVAQAIATTTTKTKDKKKNIYIYIYIYILYVLAILSRKFFSPCISLYRKIKLFKPNDQAVRSRKYKYT